MADIDDIEAYLEAQVEAAATGESAPASNGDGDGSKVEKDRSSREKDRDRKRDDRDGGRKRSRSRDRDRRRSRSRDRGGRRQRSRSKERRRRSSKSPSPREERSKEQIELDELTKDQRTVFVSQLVMKADERAIRKFFTQFGKVRSVVMIRDKATNRHKGFAYVEMADLEIIPNVLMMNNQVPDFQKFPISVAASQAEKNYIAKQELKAAGGKPEKVRGQANKVYLGNLHPNINEDDLMELLKPFGVVKNLVLHRDDTGKSKGYAFATFDSRDEAQQVMLNLSGVPLAERPIKVGPVNDHPGAAAAAKATMGAVPGATAGTASGNWRLDDDSGTGLAMDSHSRTALMAKLGQTAGLQVPVTTAPMGYPGVGRAGPGPICGLPSRALLIKNMFDLAAETEDGWELDIRDDVEDECSKHGRVLHCCVDKYQPGGFVYLLFADQIAATKSAQGLHGRWFAGRMITVDYLAESQYVTKFPETGQMLLNLY